MKNCCHSTSGSRHKDGSTLGIAQSRVSAGDNYSAEGGGRRSLEQSDLIQMEGMIVPVSRPRVTRVPPPSYNDRWVHSQEHRQDWLSSYQRDESQPAEGVPGEFHQLQGLHTSVQLRQQIGSQPTAGNLLLRWPFIFQRTQHSCYIWLTIHLLRIFINDSRIFES